MGSNEADEPSFPRLGVAAKPRVQAGAPIEERLEVLENPADERGARVPRYGFVEDGRKAPHLCETGTFPFHTLRITHIQSIH